MEYRENLIFGEEHGEPFRLETRIDSQRETHLRLFRGASQIKHKSLHNPSLKLLRYFAKHAKQELFEADILNALWSDGGDENIVEKHVSILRNHALNDLPPYKFIHTIPRRGYQFMVAVHTEGNLGGIEVFERWDRPRFYELLNKVERGRGDDGEDLRIVTTVFNSTVSELGLDALLQKYVRMKVLMLNPDNQVLMDARFSLRGDATKQRIIRAQQEQIENLKRLAARYPFNHSHEGSLECRFSDVMPCGFMAHTKRWAMFGIFPAHDSYIAGPMLEIRADTELWNLLLADWKARWTEAGNIIRKQPRKA